MWANTYGAGCLVRVGYGGARSCLAAGLCQVHHRAGTSMGVLLGHQGGGAAAGWQLLVGMWPRQTWRHSSVPGNVAARSLLVPTTPVSDRRPCFCQASQAGVTKRHLSSCGVGLSSLPTAPLRPLWCRPRPPRPPSPGRQGHGHPHTAVPQHTAQQGAGVAAWAGLVRRAVCLSLCFGVLVG